MNIYEEYKYFATKSCAAHIVTTPNRGLFVAHHESAKHVVASGIRQNGLSPDSRGVAGSGLIFLLHS